MYKNNCLLLLFFFNLIGFSQVKKVTDTIYVYETVIVHDTIFIEKPLDKISFDKIIITPGKNGGKPQLTIIQNNKKTILAVDSLIVESKKPARKPFPKPWVFGVKLAIGFNSNSFFNEFNSASQTTFGRARVYGGPRRVVVGAVVSSVGHGVLRRAGDGRGVADLA